MIYTVGFYPRGQGNAPAHVISVGEGEYEEIMRELIKRFPAADDIYLDVRTEGVRVYFDLPQAARAA